MLNDCKYGYDGQPNQLRLTLLRGSEWPDPQADKGIHHFTYAIYPHSGSWQTAKTVQHAYELNRPVQVIDILPSTETLLPKLLPPSYQFLGLNADNLCLMAFKQCEDEPSNWILRFYECEGKAADLSITNNLDLAIADRVNFLEEVIEPVAMIEPWKIISLCLRLTNELKN